MLTASKNYKEQGVPIALALSQKVLNGRGAWRLQGGGFAGTIQAFVPYDLLDDLQGDHRCLLRRRQLPCAEYPQLWRGAGYCGHVIIIFCFAGDTTMWCPPQSVNV